MREICGCMRSRFDHKYPSCSASWGLQAGEARHDRIALLGLLEGEDNDPEDGSTTGILGGDKSKDSSANT